MPLVLVYSSNQSKNIHMFAQQTSYISKFIFLKNRTSLKWIDRGKFIQPELKYNIKAHQWISLFSSYYSMKLAHEWDQLWSFRASCFDESPFDIQFLIFKSKRFIQTQSFAIPFGCNCGSHGFKHLIIQTTTKIRYV